MSTGDLKNNIKKLQSQIKAIKYIGNLDIDGIKSGSPTAFLPLYHYVFTSYSSKLNRDISNSNNELYGKSDLRFIEAVYKILRDMFSYKPPVTRDQFFLTGFSERKVIMATEILCHVHSVYSPPSISSSYKLASKVEKKQHNIQTKVQGNSQGEVKTQTKARKVAGRKGADLTEAIVLPRYVTTPRDWRDSHPPVAQNFSPTEIPNPAHSTDDLSPRQPPPSMSNASDEADVMTKQVTEHITNVLTTLNNQVGKISTALQKVEDRLECQPSPRVQETAPVSSSNSLQMETLLSKVILLENRMVMLENKVEDIQNFCTILLDNRSNSNNNSDERDTISLPPSERQVTQNERVNTGSMHPNFVNAFTPITDLGGKTVNQPMRNQEVTIGDKEDENVDQITIEDVVASDLCGQDGLQLQSKTEDMRFMKTLVGPNDSEISLTPGEHEDTSVLLREIQNANKPDLRTTNEMTTGSTERTGSHGFGHVFSPIRGHKDSSFGHFDDNSMIQVPCAGIEEDVDPRRLSSTPNKADLDTSTLSRVNRIMQMMKETQDQFNVKG